MTTLTSRITLQNTCNMPNNTSYQNYHRKLLRQLAEHINSTAPFNGGELDELQADFVEKLSAILDSSTAPATQIELGQWVLSQIVSNYQSIMPAVPRSLFWYFGGECMHYLGDEEIELFQKLEESYHEGLAADTEATDYEQLVLRFEQNAKSQLH